MKTLKSKIDTVYLQRILSQKGITPANLSRAMDRHPTFIGRILNDGYASLADINHMSMILNCDKNSLILKDTQPEKEKLQENTGGTGELLGALKIIMMQNEDILKILSVWSQTNKDQLANIITKQNLILQMQNKHLRAIEGGANNDTL